MSDDGYQYRNLFHSIDVFGKNVHKSMLRFKFYASIMEIICWMNENSCVAKSHLGNQFSECLIDALGLTTLKTTILLNHKGKQLNPQIHKCKYIENGK